MEKSAPGGFVLISENVNLRKKVTGHPFEVKPLSIPLFFLKISAPPKKTNCTKRYFRAGPEVFFKYEKEPIRDRRANSNRLFHSGPAPGEKQARTENSWTAAAAARP